MRLPIIGVMGSSTDEYNDIAEPLGKRIAYEGFHLLTGGGRGVMEAVTRAFVQVPQGNGANERKGLAIGIIPGESSSGPGDRLVYKQKDGYPNKWIELPIRTHLPLSGTQGKQPMSRNHINVLSSDYVVVLPGGPGTKTESELCSGYKMPFQFLKDAKEVDDLISAIKNTVATKKH